MNIRILNLFLFALNKVLFIWLFFFLRDINKRSFPEKCVRSDLALILEGLFLISGHKACPAMLYLWTEKVTMPDTCKV